MFTVSHTHLKCISLSISLRDILTLCHILTRGVPEPSSDAAGASAARVLILTVIGELGTREDDNVAMMEPLKDACGEVNRLQEFLEKYGVLRCRKVSDGAQGGESDGRAFL